MDLLKRATICFKILVVLLFLQNSLFAGDDFNEFAKKIYQKDLKGVKELLAKGIDINMRQETMGSTPLMVACSIKGTDEIIEYLISKGADVNVRNDQGATPLQYAVLYNNYRTAQILIENGANASIMELPELYFQAQDFLHRDGPMTLQQRINDTLVSTWWKEGETGSN